MSSSLTAPGAPAGRDPLGAYGRILTWLVVLLASVAGLGLVIAGAAILLTVDESLVAEMVADGTVRFDPLTRAELIEAGSAAAQWIGLGLLLTGLVTALAGIGFGLYRRRPVETQSPTLTIAVVGGVITLVTSFVPFSMVVGGGVAGYLLDGSRRAGAKVGAASGAVAFAPGALIMLFVFGGMTAGALSIGESTFALLAVGILLFALLVSLAFSAGLGAVGGFLGTMISEDEGGPTANRDTV